MAPPRSGKGKIQIFMHSIQWCRASYPKQLVLTYRHFRTDYINKTTQNYDEVEHIPGVTEVILEYQRAQSYINEVNRYDYSQTRKRRITLKRKAASLKMNSSANTAVKIMLR